MNVRWFVLVLTLVLLAVANLPAQTCPPPDKPDPLFQDTNIDGIDGDSSRAIFVSGAAGDDLNPGTMLLPVKTITQGITLALAALPRRDVYVAAGIYALTGSLHVADGVSLYGLYDGPPGWHRSNANVTTLSGANPVLTVDSVGSETHVEGFLILASDAADSGGSSYGITVSSSAGPVYIRYNAIHAGHGLAGGTGSGGVAGDSGTIGANGNPGSCDNSNGSGGPGGSSSCGRAGGNGGAGGPEGANPGSPGGTGTGGSAGGTGGTATYQGSIFGTCPAGGPGGAGADGDSGSAGSNGAVAPALGSFAGVIYMTASGSNGTDGSPGNGGGGGGGGGGQGGLPCNDGGGNGGGGGGGGGCGGTHGAGGQGGGGSFGIVSSNSYTVIDADTITAAAGCAGGYGGNGASGGPGGSGGIGASACTAEIGAGGNGGTGGKGGVGGAGSGGTGGPSVGIVSLGSPHAVLGANAVTTGSGGAAGGGGVNALGSAPDGQTGVATSVYGTTDPLVSPTPLACISDVMIAEPYPGPASATFTVYLSVPIPSPVNIAYITLDSSATAGSDYVAASGNIVFSAGEVMKQVNVQVLGDTLVEPDEVFFLKLSTPLGAQFADSIGRAVITDHPGVIRSYGVQGRWNLLSLPLRVDNDSVDALYPTASSPAFEYDPSSSYFVVQRIANGPGYWLKYSSSQPVVLAGFPRIADTVQVKRGWNLIGALSDSFPVASVVTIPPGLLASPFYGYTGSYAPEEVFQPSAGYWVKANDSGAVIRTILGAQTSTKASPPAGEVGGVNTIRVRDANGNAQSLFFGRAVTNDEHAAATELPPVPPPGAFDARFASGQNTALVSGTSSQEHAIQISATAFPVRLSWEIRHEDVAATLRIGGAVYGLTRDGEALVTSLDQPVALELASQIIVPQTLALEQNYPNPFNPSTKIPYSLPQAVHVRITIFNLLGQKVSTVVDGDMQAGYHQSEWDASDVPSGVYMCRLEAGSFTATRKLILMK